jgi:tetraacyldisaccharide-1-P 4'-kinase
MGNAACLPAGPLREPPSRLHEVDFVVGNGAARGCEYLMCAARRDGAESGDPVSAPRWPGFPQCTIHAVAGIGDPGDFSIICGTPGCGSSSIRSPIIMLSARKIYVFERIYRC